MPLAAAQHKSSSYQAGSDQMMEVETIVEEAEPDVSSQLHNTCPPPTTDVPIRDRGLGKVKETGPPISASLGAMRALIGKLDMLLDPSSPQGWSSKRVKDGMRLLKDDVEKMSSYLDDLSEVEDPPPTAKCWMNEARDLSYNMEDYIDNLLFVPPEDPSLVTNNIKTTISLHKWFCCVKTHKTQDISAETLSKFRIYVQEAIERHQRYNLHSCNTIRHRFVSLGPMLPPRPYEESPNIVIDGRMNEFINSLANDEDQQLKVISVLGSAYLGKTTLARVLYTRFGNQYSCRAFIRVSKKPDMKIIFHDMLSQLQRQHPPQHYMEIDLIHNIKQYLQDKRYLIIIDDVWAASVWDIINHVFPKGNYGSRIITTTQIEDVALTCCSYQSEDVFEMKRLDDDHSRKLFFNRLFGSERDCPEFKDVLNEIVETCDGLPLATISIASLLASQPVMSIDYLTYIHRSLSSCFSASEITSQALNLSFNNLPHYLKTCLMYPVMYPEGYIFCKDDLMRQWMAEGFIDTTEGQDMEEVAESYLHQLIVRRFIQPIRISYNNEVLSCTVHGVVHDLIALKSTEENFIVAIDYSQKDVALSHKARRLSLLFGDARHAKTPANIIKSQVRSLTYFGLFQCMPRITEFKHLRILNLQLSGHHGDDDSVDLTGISELFQLRYLKIASNAFIKLPNHGLQCLETLDMNATIVFDPRDIHLPNLLHLRIPIDRNLSTWSLNMNRFGYLQDLHLTTSSAPPSFPGRGIEDLSSLIRGHVNLKTVVVAHGSSVQNIVDRGSSKETIYWNHMESPPFLQRFEFSRHSGCIFSRIPPWVEKHDNLSILKIAVKELQMICVSILRGLPALTALSLHVETMPVDKIIFDKPGFSVLKYMKLRFTSVVLLKFEADAMPNLLKLKLAVNDIPRMCQHQHATAAIILDHMPGLQEVSVKFGGAAADVEYALRTFVSNHPSNPTISMQPVDYSSCGEENTKRKHRQGEIVEGEPVEYYKQQQDEIVDDESVEYYKQQQDEIVEDEPVEYYKQQQDEIVEDEPVEYCKQQQDEIVDAEPVEYYKQQQAEIVDDEPVEYYKQQQVEIVDDEPVEYYKQESDEIVEEERVEYYKQQPDKIVGEKAVGYYKQQPYKIAEEEPVEYDKTLEIPAVKRIPRSPEPSSRVHVPEKETLGRAGEKSQSIRVDVNKVGLHEFTLDKLISATSNFSEKNLLGEGTFGTTYKGTIDGKRMVAITKLPFGSWLPELEYLGTIHHPHLVSLLGYCHQDTHNIYVYEYMPKGSLKHHLFETNLAPLPWLTRLKIAVGAAKGLFFLHESANRRLCGGFGASSILLASDYTAKLWGFVLEMHDDLMTKINVFDFGVVLLELLVGRPAVDEERHHPEKNLVDLLTPYMGRKDKLHHIMDPRLEGQYSSSAASITSKIVRRCLHSKPKKRPSMWTVVEALEPLLSDDRNDGQLLLASGKAEPKKTKLSECFTSKSEAKKSQRERQS